MVRDKNNAVPANAFSVSPLPAPALERPDVAAKWVRFKLVKGLVPGEHF